MGRLHHNEARGPHCGSPERAAVLEKIAKGLSGPVGTRVALTFGMALTVQPIKISGLEQNPLRDRAARLMTKALAKLTVGPIKGQASFFDDNGPKGGQAMRCALTVRLPFRPSIRVERSAVTPRLAFEAAFTVLERRLERYRERDRDNKRHTKKYFLARLALAGETSPRKRARRGLARRTSDHITL